LSIIDEHNITHNDKNKEDDEERIKTELEFYDYQYMKALAHKMQKNYNIIVKAAKKNAELERKVFENNSKFATQDSKNLQEYLNKCKKIEIARKSRMQYRMKSYEALLKNKQIADNVKRNVRKFSHLLLIFFILN